MKPYLHLDCVSRHAIAFQGALAVISGYQGELAAAGFCVVLGYVTWRCQ